VKPRAIQILRDEHLAIASVLYSLRQQVRGIRDHAAAPDFRLLHAIFDYIVSYPDRWHHPKENDFLFARLSRRTAEADALIAELREEHAAGHPMLDALKRDLVEFEAGRLADGEEFFRRVEAYVAFEWQHMTKEEEALMPIAERVLEADDWKEIARAFEENDNPLFGIKPKDEAAALYQRILALVPERPASASRRP
jgi:hemerythrin-like domain-containing protein